MEKWNWSTYAANGDDMEDRVRLATSAGYIKRVHVNQHTIKTNKKNGTDEPTITVQTSKGPVVARAVNILGDSKVIYSPEKPLSCGATVWIETVAAMELEQ